MITTGPSRGGYVTNVKFSNLVAQEGAIFQDGILVDASYRAANPSCPPGWKPAAAPKMSDYSFTNIDGTDATIAGAAFHLKGGAANVVQRVTIENVHFAQGGWDCSNVTGTAKTGTITPWPPCPEIKVVA